MVSLDDDIVQERRWQYQALREGQGSGTPRKMTMTFDELFEAFQSDCITQVQIAKANNVSRERIRQIYDEWFRDLFEDKSGRDRVAACTLVNRAIRLENLRYQGLDDPSTFVGRVAQKATLWGFGVERIVSVSYVLSPFRLRVNSKMVGLHWVSKFTAVGPRQDRYGRVNVSRGKLQGEFAVVIYLEPWDQFYVVPTSPILGILGRKDATILYIPQERALEQRRPSRINFWDHVERWDLLK